MLEKQIEAKVCEYAKTKGAHYLQKLAEVLQERDDDLKHQLDSGCQGA
jgi:hypothetical protein